jgi:hypothetical protein
MENQPCSAYIKSKLGAGYIPCSKKPISTRFCLEHHEECRKNPNLMNIFQKIDDIYCISKLNSMIKKISNSSDFEEKVSTLKETLDFIIQHKFFIDRNPDFKTTIINRLVIFKKDDDVTKFIDIDFYINKINSNNDQQVDEFFLNKMEDYNIVINI